jgi:hypothetical protein
VFGDLIGNVPRAIGIKSIGGTMFYPQPSWLSNFGLSTSNPIVNRYAHVVVELAPQGAEPSAVLRHNDAFTLMIDPYNNRTLSRVGVKIVGAREQEKPHLIESRFTLLSEGGGYFFYQPSKD